MMNTSTASIAAILIALIVVPQGYSQENNARRKRGEDPPIRGGGQLYITPLPKDIPRSLKHLYDMADVVVEGTVTSILAVRETGIRSLETDAAVQVERTIKGPADLRSLVIAQRGGTKGELSIQPMQYSLVEPGEKYLLFLNKDNRPNLPTTENRYVVTGVWSGLFPFHNGRMTLRTSQPDPLRKAYEGLTIDEIIREIKASLEQR